MNTCKLKPEDYCTYFCRGRVIPYKYSEYTFNKDHYTTFKLLIAAVPLSDEIYIKKSTVQSELLQEMYGDDCESL